MSARTLCGPCLNRAAENGCRVTERRRRAHGLRYLKDLLGARVIGFKLAEQNPFLAGVVEGAEHLEFTHGSGIVLVVGEREGVKHYVLDERERHPPVHAPTE